MRVLWDFSLRRALSMKVMGAMYGVIFWFTTIASGVFAVVSLIMALDSANNHDGEGMVISFLAMLAAPVIALAVILVTRLQFEFLAAIFRIADATEHTARQARQF